MRKSYPPTVQWTGNLKAAGSNLVGDNFFALLVLSCRRSGDSSALVATRPESRKTITNLYCDNNLIVMFWRLLKKIIKKIYILLL